MAGGRRPLLLALLSSVLLVVVSLCLLLPSTTKFKLPPLIQFSTFQLQPPEKITPPHPSPTVEAPPPRNPSANTEQNSEKSPSPPRNPSTNTEQNSEKSPQKTTQNPSTKTEQDSKKPTTKATRDPTTNTEHNLETPGPYHNWEHFNADYDDMMENLRIYVYPDVHAKGSRFSNIFLPRPDAKKLGNYYSEHAFKAALLSSPLLTSRPEEAHFFYMPFSINLMRYDRRLHSAESIKKFVAEYANRVSLEYPFWNASGGADHLYVCCHSIGRDAALNHGGLQKSAIQVTCSSSYFQRLYVSHKDVTLPQVWPRTELDQGLVNPPNKRNKLVFFAGRQQNARVRERLIALWGNETSMDIFSNNRAFPYEEGFRRSKYCLSVKGYEVNTARVSDAIHFGCIPVIISDYYDLPLNNVLDWSKFSIIINEQDIGFLKKILLSISKETYLTMLNNLFLVRKHFSWNTPPRRFDSFYMTAYQLWLRRGLHRLSYEPPKLVTSGQSTPDIPVR